ncbi:unnamed protein product, partial [marine sediment metagenome]
PLAELIVVPGSEMERKAVELFQDHFLEELNVKKVTLRESADDMITFTVECNMKTIGPKFGRNAAAAREAISQLDGRAVEEAFARGGPVFVTIEGNRTPIDPDDVTISRSYGDDWAGAADGKTVVMIDRRLTPELKNEGLARDIVRNVQNLRKEAGLDIADRIRLSLTTESEKLKAAIDRFGEYIQNETLALEIVARPLAGKPARTDIKIEAETLRIELAKA